MAGKAEPLIIKMLMNLTLVLAGLEVRASEQMKETERLNLLYSK